MKHLKDNLLVQFSLASFLIIGMLAIVLSAVITTQLEHNIEHLQDHGAAMMTGAMINANQLAIATAFGDWALGLVG